MTKVRLYVMLVIHNVTMESSNVSKNNKTTEYDKSTGENGQMPISKKKITAFCPTSQTN